MTGPPLPPDPLALVTALRAADIRQRLAELEGQERALRVLLRSAAAREKAVTTVQKTKSLGAKGVSGGE